MPNLEEKRRDRWERLSQVPSDVMDLCISLVKGTQQDTLQDLFSLLAECDDQDLSRLNDSTSQDILKIYDEFRMAAEENDPVKCIRQSIVDNPVEIYGHLDSAELSDISYRIIAKPDRIYKGREERMTVVEVHIPCDVTFTYGNQSVTVEHVYTGMIGQNKAKNAKSQINKLYKSIRDSVMWFPQSGFKNSDLRYGEGIPWRNNSLLLYNFLWKHPIGESIKSQIQKERHYSLRFDHFDAHLLPFVQELVKLHKAFDCEMREENSIGFLFADNSFVVFTESDGVYRMDSHGRHNYAESGLTKKLELAKVLTH